MRILIIRHGDPDYVRDSLTEKGWKEAGMLAEWMKNQEVDAFYVSPLGRAQDTASLTLKALGRTAETLDWLQEFTPRIRRPDSRLRRTVAWDWLPEDWTADERFYDRDGWSENEIFQEAHVREAYEAVVGGFDRLLASYGYRRDGHLYRTEKGTHRTICLFCHFGLEMVLISHILGVSPMPLWHGFCSAPTGVTEIYTEERRKGTVSLRISSFGSVAHLQMAGDGPSFAARYAECWEDDTAH